MICFVNTTIFLPYLPIIQHIQSKNSKFNNCLQNKQLSKLYKIQINNQVGAMANNSVSKDDTHQNRKFSPR